MQIVAVMRSNFHHNTNLIMSDAKVISLHFICATCPFDMTKARPQFDLQNGLCAIRNVAINYLQTIFQTK